MIVFQVVRQEKKKTILPELLTPEPKNEADFVAHSTDQTKFDFSKGIKLREKAEFDKLNVGDISSLPSSSKYPGLRLRQVDEGDAGFIQPGSKIQALYTSHAMECAILICVAKKGGRAVAGALAHINFSWDYSEDVTRFFNQLKQIAGPDASFEISMVSGSEGKAREIFHEASKFVRGNPGSKFGFISCDLDGGRDDASILSIKDGVATIYYGHPNENIAIVDDKPKSFFQQFWHDMKMDFGVKP